MINTLLFTMGSMSEPVRELDVLIVGAGFGAFALLHRSEKSPARINYRLIMLVDCVNRA